MKPEYLGFFVAELRSYLEDLRQQSFVIASPTRSGESLERAVRVLQRLGHTIAGVANTVGLADFLLLGSALEEVLTRFLQEDVVPPGMFVAPMTRLAVYFELRVNAIDRFQQFLPASIQEETEAERVVAALRNYLPTPPPPREIHHLLATANAAPPARTEGLPADDRIRLGLSAADQAIIDAFLRTDLPSDPVPAPPRPRSMPSRAPIIDQELLQEFVDEVTDAIAQMRQVLAEIPKYAASGDIGRRNDLLRLITEVAHRIQGTAFTVGFVSISTVANMQRSILKSVRRRRLALSDAMHQWLIASVDAQEHLIERVRGTGEESAAPELLAHLHETYVFILTEMPDEEAAPTTSTTDPVTDDSLPAIPTLPTTVRIPIRQVDQLLATIGTQQLNRHTLEHLRQQALASEQELAAVVRRLRDLEQQVRDERRLADQGLLTHPSQSLDGAAHALVAHRRAEPSSEFSQLMVMIGEATADLSAIDLDLRTTLNQLGRQGEYHDYLTELAQRDVLGLRLVPFADLMPRLQLTVQSTAIAEGKDATLVVRGAHAELDRDISAALLEPLMQLLRNAVVHGIETSAERQSRGKPPQATVVLHYAVDADHLLIEVTDDGRGIDPDRLIAAAQRTQGPDGLFLLDADRAALLTPTDALELIFQPDLSTMAEARPTAGQGVGLAAVKRAILAVRGTITVVSALGEGTTFRLRVPISLGMVRGVRLLIGDFGYIVPTEEIRRRCTLTADALEVRDDKIYLAQTDQQGRRQDMIAFTLGDLLDRPDLIVSGQHAVIIAVEGIEVAVIADWQSNHLAGKDDAFETFVVRQIPAFLRHRGMRHAALAPRGELALVVDLPALAARALRRATRTRGQFSPQHPLGAHAPLAPERGEQLLVVDDSPSIQRGLLQTLTAAGYTVTQARDGVEARAMMLRSLPRLMILDVEMPNMNGFQLLEQMQADPHLRGVPTIMLTSRASATYQEQAKRLGAVGYLTKPAATEELLRLVAKTLAVHAFAP